MGTTPSTLLKNVCIVESESREEIVVLKGHFASAHADIKSLSWTVWFLLSPTQVLILPNKSVFIPTGTGDFLFFKFNYISGYGFKSSKNSLSSGLFYFLDSSTTIPDYRRCSMCTFLHFFHPVYTGVLVYLMKCTFHKMIAWVYSCKCAQ